MHETTPLTVDHSLTESVITRTFQGDFEELDSLASSYSITQKVDNYGILTSLRLTRVNAGRGQLEMVCKQIDTRATWGFSFSEISKPIRTWLALKIQDQATLDNELLKIDLWEQQKTIGKSGMNNYLKYRYTDTQSLTGDTLKLAKKMRQGIDSYSIYTPIATCTRLSGEAFTDGINSIGKYTTSLPGNGPSFESNSGQLAAFSGLRPYWLKTGDDISGNSDGTLTRRESWMGLDKIDEDLYSRG